MLLGIFFISCNSKPNFVGTWITEYDDNGQKFTARVEIIEVDNSTYDVKFYINDKKYEKASGSYTYSKDDEGNHQLFKAVKYDGSDTSLQAASDMGTYGVYLKWSDGKLYSPDSGDFFERK